jgi:glycosyltransferase involved in cell wall biosynthesis
MTTSELSEKLIKILYKIVNFAKSFLQKIIPTDAWPVLRRLLPSKIFYSRMENLLIREWQDAREELPWDPTLQEFQGGVNLIGYFRAVKGISEAARNSVLALEAAKIPYTVNDYEFGIPAWQQVDDLPHSQNGNGFKFNTNLIHINPPQLPFLWNIYKKSELTGRYNIGVWYWELPDLPQDWCSAFGIVDEVWAATQFIFDSVSVKSPVPVVKIPPCIHPIYDQRLNRSDFKLPADQFIFMCAYDVLSIQARKNPLGAVNAFKQAFQKNDSSVGLVIKVNNAAENPQEIKKLHALVDGFPNCYIIEDIFDKLKFNSLLNTIDAYISLHRSEGFGLIPAEAMSFGKPVVMTRWSGNLDFMTPINSCGVDYRLIPVNETSGPYLPGQFWADPDVDHASFLMQRLVSDKKYYTEISKQAQITIQEFFSPHHVGQLIKKRMLEIGLLP